MSQIYDIPVSKFKAKNGKAVIVASYENIQGSSVATSIVARVLLKGTEAIQKVLLLANIASVPAAAPPGGASVLRVKAILVNGPTTAAANLGSGATPLGVLNIKDETSEDYKENAWLCYWEIGTM